MELSIIHKREKTCHNAEPFARPVLAPVIQLLLRPLHHPALGWSSCAPSYQLQQYRSCICRACLLPLLQPLTAPFYSLSSCLLWSFERYPELLPPVDLRLAPLLLPSHPFALLSFSLKLPACSLRTRPITQQGTPQASCSIRRNIDECL